ncbi:hypothetical protein ANCDUO_09203 [Ancylostoma duodenale]|uniref:Peroxiredoxin-like 2A n=1 Tax=Ancylostoma duodenale TaxID=51022 RepID=A0A0C2GH75_9BILA|nr:hypothetical protein ANCDUO_09203 [Ancylostoma duodenale]
MVQASSLFSKGPTMVMAVRRPGCMLCRKEAAELSTLEPNMKAAGINLVAVVHETKGVNDFKPYFKGEVYFDKESSLAFDRRVNRSIVRCDAIVSEIPAALLLTVGEMAMFGYGALAALGGAFLYANLPTRLTIGAVAPTVSYLSGAKLIPIAEESRVDEAKMVQASSLFSKGPTMVMAVRRPGCMLCRKEAAELSTLEPNMKAAGINLKTGKRSAHQVDASRFHVRLEGAQFRSFLPA